MTVMADNLSNLFTPFAKAVNQPIGPAFSSKLLRVGSSTKFYIAPINLLYIIRHLSVKQIFVFVSRKCIDKKIKWLLVRKRWLKVAKTQIFSLISICTWAQLQSEAKMRCLLRCTVKCK